MWRQVMAVFGGSFNPPHLGHVLLPTYLKARGLADRVLVAPTFEHALGKSLPPFRRRLAWSRVAMGVHGDWVEVTEIEAELAAATGKPSYTLHLLEAVQQRHPEYEVRLVIGSDITETGETDKWHRWDEIARRFSPIVVPRAGYAPAGTATLPEISSTKIREWLHNPEEEGARRSLEASVPAEVLKRVLSGDKGWMWIVGHGNVATHARRWLEDHGWNVHCLGARAVVKGQIKPPEWTPEGVWILAPDAKLAEVSAALHGRLPANVPFLHGAGAMSAAKALPGPASAGRPVGSLHPICALRKELSRHHLEAARFGVEGHPSAVGFAERIVPRPRWIDLGSLDEGQRLGYHAACALAANHLAVLDAAAAEVLVGQGHDRRRVDAAMAALMRSALDNLLALGFPAGVTGPAARGDRATVRAHLDALDADTAALYRELSERLAYLLAARDA